MYLMTVNSGIKDATDHYLTFCCGKLFYLKKYENVYILTKDHYGHCIEDIEKSIREDCSLEDVKNGKSVFKHITEL